MDKQFFFERNLLALSGQNPGLCSRLSTAETTLNRYKFLESRSGEIIPALVDSAGGAHPLHSLIDPRREGERLISTIKNEGFLIFLGLGGGFAVEAALKRPEVYRVLVVDYDINGLAELFCSREYINILGDPRVCLLAGPSEEELESYILEQYQPVLSGGIRVLPLRTRTEFDAPRFKAAGEAVQKTLTRVSADYSVQAYFGTRWFSNIIRNLETVETQSGPFPPVRNVVICAAGPSLDDQIPLLAEQRRSKDRPFVIAADTSLPTLLQAGMEPDAVISIDCQHISYYHFMAGFPPHIPLFLDLASPPLLAARSTRPRFFSGGHPLAAYISRRWRPIPPVDTSGANVTYAGLSLAENLGAEEIVIYGADFSYPQGQVYSRGTYVYPYFDIRQNRLSPKEALCSAFLYRDPSLVKIAGSGAASWYYETSTLRRYRIALEEKVAGMEIPVHPAPGRGAPIRIYQTGGPKKTRIPRIFAAGPARNSAGAFLREYRTRINALPAPGQHIPAYIARLNEEDRAVFTTLLPQAAAIKRREPGLGPAEIIEAARDYSVREIDRLTGNWG
jgi:hypothetical protein